MLLEVHKNTTCPWFFYSDGHLIFWSALEATAMGKYTTQTHHDSATHHTTTGQPLSGQQPVRFDSSDFCEVRGHLYRPGHRSLECVCVEFWWFPGASQNRKGPIRPRGDSAHLQTKLPTVLHQNWLTCDPRWRNVGCETSGMLFLHMAFSARKMNSREMITEIYN